MNLYLLYLAFLISCATIFICLTKRQMKVARAVFLSLGILIGFSSALLLLAKQLIKDPFDDNSLAIQVMLTYVLGIASLIFYSATLIVVVATVIISLFVVQIISNLLKKAHIEKVGISKYYLKLPTEATLFTRKLNLLFCRFNN